MVRPILTMAMFVIALSSLVSARGVTNQSALSVLKAVPPQYPSVARAAHVSGEVVVEVSVDSEGAVTQVIIVSGHKPLTGSAEKAASRWRFNSVERGAQKRKARLTFQFTLVRTNKGTPDDLGVVFWPPYKVEVRDAPYRVD